MLNWFHAYPDVSTPIRTVIYDTKSDSELRISRSDLHQRWSWDQTSGLDTIGITGVC